MSCSCCIPLAANTPHAIPSRSHNPYPPQKKIKKNSEKGGAPAWMPPRGGGLPSPGMMPHAPRVSKAHTQATRQQCTPHGAMHHQHAARRQTQPVCVRNVRLQANRKTCVSSRVWRNYINIFIYYAKPEEDTYILPPPHVRRLGLLKNTTPPRIYTVPSTPPQHCHDAARTDGRRQDAWEHTAKRRPDPAKKKGAK